jgi:hypothetical protein
LKRRSSHAISVDPRYRFGPIKSDMDQSEADAHMPEDLFGAMEE